MSTDMSSLILASASPRRWELLARIGIAVEVIPANIDESLQPGTLPLDHAVGLAIRKAAVVAKKAPGRWVLGADTIVEVGGDILGKAADGDEALAMVRRLSGCTHRVSTGFALCGPGSQFSQVVTTEVTMRTAGDDELAEYVRAGEWRGKAGAYAIQGMAAALVTEIRGSVTNVIGLPLAEVIVALAERGIAVPRYGDRQASVD